MAQSNGPRPLALGAVAIGLGLALGVGALPAIDAVRRAVLDNPDWLPWFGTRLLAFLAYLSLAGSVVYGLLLSTRLLERIVGRPVSFTLHRDLVAVGLVLALGHAALLTIDTSVPFTLAEVLVPFIAPYRPLWVGLGQVALVLTAAVYLAFAARRRVGQRPWKALHSLAFAAFVITTAHGVASGSDTGQPWAWWLYATVTALTAFLVVYRVSLVVAGSLTTRSGRSGRPARVGATMGADDARPLDGPRARPRGALDPARPD